MHIIMADWSYGSDLSGTVFNGPEMQDPCIWVGQGITSHHTDRTNFKAK